MVIEVNLTDTDPKKAVRKLNDYIKSIPHRTDRLAKKLAEIAQRAAWGAYGTSIPVTITPIDNGYQVTAYGKSVCILEFGAGTAVDTNHEYAKKMPFEVKPGSWSETHSKQFVTKGHWFFAGQYYVAVRPRKGMWTASKAIRKDVAKAAAEVFGRK